MTVDFKFEIDQRVTTVFDDIGIIEMAAIDDALQKKYYIQRSSDSQWMKEAQLRAVDTTA